MDYYAPLPRAAFFWTWYAISRHFYIPALSNRLIALRLDWVTLGVL